MKATAKVGDPVERLPRLTLKRRTEQRDRAAHPWIFSNELADPKLIARLEIGALAEIIDCHGDYLGTALCHPKSLIAARLLSNNRSEKISQEFFARKIEAALALREGIYGEKTAAKRTYRAVFGESDGLPGLILDRFDNTWVMQFHSAGMWQRKTEILNALLGLVESTEGKDSVECVVGRTDVQSAGLEGMPDVSEVLHGKLPSTGIFAHEGGIKFPVDPLGGQKTGFYFDQRENRATFARLIEARIASGQEVRMADLYCHIGAWGLTALAAGAIHVTFVDSSAAALAVVEKILAQKGWAKKATLICGDAKEEIRKIQKQKKSRFEFISLDPPSFIPNRKSAPQGLKAYSSMNSLAGDLVAPGGILATSSCSHNCLEDRFEETVASSLRKIGREPRLIHRGWPAHDHPARPGMPESNYLKCLYFAI